MKNILLSFLLFISTQVAAQEPKFRTFTGHEDEFSVEAKLVDIGKRSVEIECRDGKIKTIKHSQLSRKDLLYVINQMAINAETPAPRSLSKLASEYKSVLRQLYKDLRQSYRLPTEREREQAKGEAFQPLSDLNGEDVSFSAQVKNVKQDGGIVFSADEFFDQFRINGKQHSTVTFNGKWRKEILDELKVGAELTVRGDLVATLSGSSSRTYVARPGETLVLLSGTTPIRENKYSHYVVYLRNLVVEIAEK